MTFDDFLTRLRNTPRTWVLVSFGVMDNKLQIRTSEGRCPLAEVFDDAKSGGIELATDAGLIHSAISHVWIHADDCKSHEGYDPIIRTQLLKACGL